MRPGVVMWFLKSVIMQICGENSQTLTSNNPGKQMDVQCKDLEKDWSFTVGSDRIEVIREIWWHGHHMVPTGGIRGVWDVVCVSKKGKHHKLLTKHHCITHTTKNISTTQCSPKLQESKYHQWGDFVSVFIKASSCGACRHIFPNTMYSMG